ncbi:probable envelope ADP,ATP carrier protein, chloroplastic [Mangifera indica]|uniref:probable envelope ADP,ATP carrier protein, chloroplastic n=1 Tax=Mangifera indica TaxID=29780 RepID=UPI001CFB93C9|nr:probable envelope ADP,ATP carrier protein, chloroplastic [Mangifera indica]
MREESAVVTFRRILNLQATQFSFIVTTPEYEPLWTTDARLSCSVTHAAGGGGKGRVDNFSCLAVAEKRRQTEFQPAPAQLAKFPLVLLAYVSRDAAIFAAGAIAGAAAKIVTAPLDRIKMLMQTHGVRAGQEGAKKAIGFIESCIAAIALIAKEEGIKGYWKGNLPQVIKIIPYSAVQLFAYETHKKLFKDRDRQLSVIGRLAAGACAGMTSTFVTYPLDVLRLRLAVEPGYRTMSEVALNMLREKTFASFYYWVGPSLIGIAPYIAVNFCIFDLVKKALPEKYQQKTQSSLLTAVVLAGVATLTCYALDTIRRQMQTYKSVLDAFTAHGVVGLYRGFLPNALKNLRNTSIRLTTFDTMKRLITSSEKEFQKLAEENRQNFKIQMLLIFLFHRAYGDGSMISGLLQQLEKVG